MTKKVQKWPLVGYLSHPKTKSVGEWELFTCMNSLSRRFVLGGPRRPPLTPPGGYSISLWNIFINIFINISINIFLRFIICFRFPSLLPYFPSITCSSLRFIALLRCASLRVASHAPFRFDASLPPRRAPMLVSLRLRRLHFYRSPLVPWLRPGLDSVSFRLRLGLGSGLG